ncbi:hypothetical protein P0G09_19435, partial [Faecalibacterium sp. DFI.5.82]|nr:hypothetical protein [Faecalibacterium sp. DFI.5.82]
TGGKVSPAPDNDQVITLHGSFPRFQTLQKDFHGAAAGRNGRGIAGPLCGKGGQPARGIVGILCESVCYGYQQQGRGILCGIGINLAQPQSYFDAADLP